MAARAKAKAERKPTDYVVLELQADSDGTDEAPHWMEVGRASCKGRLGREHAIEEVIGDKLGTFKAVEAKAWDTGISREQTTLIVNKRLGADG